MKAWVVFVNGDEMPGKKKLPSSFMTPKKGDNPFAKMADKKAPVKGGKKK